MYARRVRQFEHPDAVLRPSLSGSHSLEGLAPPSGPGARTNSVESLPRGNGGGPFGASMGSITTPARIGARGRSEPYRYGFWWHTHIYIYIINGLGFIFSSCVLLLCPSASPHENYWQELSSEGVVFPLNLLRYFLDYWNPYIELPMLPSVVKIRWMVILFCISCTCKV